MASLSQYSDEELMRAAGLRLPPDTAAGWDSRAQTPSSDPKGDYPDMIEQIRPQESAKQDLSSIPDDELMRIAGASTATANGNASAENDPAKPLPGEGFWDYQKRRSIITPFASTAKQGVKDLGDFLSFGSSYVGNHPERDELARKYKAGTADRLDYQRAFLEGMANSPGGKILGAVGGITPEGNIATTVLNKWINPAIEEATGADHSTISLLEMAVPAGVAAVRPSLASKVVSNVPMTKAATYPLRHPIDSASAVVRGVSDIAKPIVQPAVRGIIEGDNPITGEPGLKTALASDIAKEGQRIGDKFGYQPSAAELTGSPMAINIEDALANSGRWGSRFTEVNRQKTNALISGFNKTLDRISPQASTRTDVGDRIAATYHDTIDNLVKTRDQQARVDFDMAVAGKGARNENILSNNFFKTLNELKEEGSARLLTSREELGAQLANKYLSRLSSKTKAGNTQADMISIYELQKGLSSFSKAARRPGGVIDDANTAAMRSAYARLASALEKDLDAEIANPKGSPERAAALKLARDNYRGYSDKISDIEKTTLGKIMGEAVTDSQGKLQISPEKIADRFTAMQPAELHNTLQFLDKSNPDIANMARRYTLERALQNAVRGRGLRGEGTTKEFSRAEFVKNLPDRETLQVLIKDKSAFEDIVDVAAGMNRMIDWGAKRSGSQTAQRTQLLDDFKNLGKGTLWRSIVSDSLAEDLMNPAKRRQMAIEVRNRGNKP